jgi:hypothetical protein
VLSRAQRWQWPRAIRPEENLLMVVHYVERNPVRARLAHQAENWI